MSVHGYVKEARPWLSVWLRVCGDRELESRLEVIDREMMVSGRVLFQVGLGKAMGLRWVKLTVEAWSCCGLIGLWRKCGIDFRPWVRAC